MEAITEEEMIILSAVLIMILEPPILLVLDSLLLKLLLRLEYWWENRRLQKRHDAYDESTFVEMYRAVLTEELELRQRIAEMKEREEKKTGADGSQHPAEKS